MIKLRRIFFPPEREEGCPVAAQREQELLRKRWRSGPLVPFTSSLPLCTSLFFGFNLLSHGMKSWCRVISNFLPVRIFYHKLV